MKANIKVAQISRGDLLGGRFNGYSVRHMLAERGIQSYHLAYEPRASGPDVKALLQYRAAAASWLPHRAWNAAWGCTRCCNT